MPKWHKQSKMIINRAIIARILYFSLPMAGMCVWVFSNYYQYDLALARTMTLTTLVSLQWFSALACRSLYTSIVSMNFLSNRWLLAALVMVAGLQLLIVYVHWFQNLFKTVALNGSQWLMVIGAGLVMLVIEEMRKKLVHTKVWQRICR